MAWRKTADQPPHTGLLAMMERGSFWRLALVHTAEAMRGKGIGACMWASALKHLKTGVTVSVEAPASLSGSAKEF